MIFDVLSFAEAASDCPDDSVGVCYTYEGPDISCINNGDKVLERSMKHCIKNHSTVKNDITITDVILTETNQRLRRKLGGNCGACCRGCPDGELQYDRRTKVAEGDWETAMEEIPDVVFADGGEQRALQSQNSAQYFMSDIARCLDKVLTEFAQASDDCSKPARIKQGYFEFC